MDHDNGKRYYSVEECAKLLTISKSLCYTLIQQKRIPALKLGERRLIVPRASLDEWIEKQLAVKA